MYLCAAPAAWHVLRKSSAEHVCHSKRASRYKNVMCIYNKTLSLIYKIALAGVSGLGIYLTSGLRGGAFNPFMLNFFTILANYAVFIYFTVAAVFCARGKSAPLPSLKGGITMAVLATFIIYQFVLVPYHEVDYFRWENTIVHQIVPLMVLADFILFDEKGRFSKADPLFWCALPLAYLGFCLVRAEVGPVLMLVDSRYPYFFIDVDAQGAGGVAINTLLFLAGYIALGYALYAVDRALGKMKSATTAKTGAAHISGGRL